MALSEDYTRYIMDQLSSWGGVSYKRMFGGAALYKEGLAFGLIAHNNVYFKVDENNRNRYIKLGSKQLQPFKNNATVLSFYSVPVEILEDSELFINWAEESLNIQKKINNLK